MSYPLFYCGRDRSRPYGGQWKERNQKNFYYPGCALAGKTEGAYIYKYVTGSFTGQIAPGRIKNLLEGAHFKEIGRAHV